MRYTVVVPPVGTLDWGNLRRMPVPSIDVVPE
jgi:hypothetical protein